MFKITNSSLGEAFDPFFGYTAQIDADLVSQFTLTEAWAGDLSNGVIRLGERAKAFHGLENSECGLLSMMRCYDGHDRAHILELFEKAATSSSTFCYSTTIQRTDGHRQPVFCIGESNGLEQLASGSMSGIFVFPRFKLAATPLRQMA